MSCMSKQDKIKKFVSDYNRIMTDKTPDVTLQFLKAEPIGDNEIKINLQFNSTLNNMQKTIFKNLLPKLFQEMTTSMNQSKDLLNEGITFNYVFLDKENNVIFSQKYNKKYVDEHIGSNVIQKSNYNLDNIVELMNESLPIVDTINNLSILKIKIKSKNEIVYSYVYHNKELDELFESEDLESLFRDEYLKDKSLRLGMKQFFKLGVTKFYFNNYNHDKSKVISILLTKEDFNNMQ